MNDFDWSLLVWEDERPLWAAAQVNHSALSVLAFGLGGDEPLWEKEDKRGAARALSERVEEAKCWGWSPVGEGAEMLTRRMVMRRWEWER